MKKKLLRFLTGVFTLVFMAQYIFSDEITESGRQVIEKGKSRIVSLKVVASTLIRNQKEEIKLESQGIVINENGMVLAAYSSIDPVKYLIKMFSSLGMGSQASNLKKMTSSIDDIKYVLINGKEVQAKLVITDKDLDLAIIKPEKPGEKLDFFEVKELAKPALFDKMLAFFRLSKDYNRELSFVSTSVNCNITKPEELFLVEGGLPMGCILFNQQGKFAGLSVSRSTSEEDTKSLGMSNSMVTSIIPVKEILDIIKQAEEKK
ncbi:MAG: hypothetical protein A2452_05390 [Candidatus Firestonebacteria bacterium RIFOXYC2_FULL_39_67]|nr:MAG: hypothetical protein A2536_10220 [Candidatus Firestonebacteria bacterium RIFOXYD2_FULL_39_29]OGF55901.1 MAG: hypothetical protein A2497_04885 [Candidatus Firestonebacteria bacterium RifOxyC12_full_39_7]OGF56373.1 MAG: hypothetical protein A2452_05390 [Candidatus Firestonebacteria bacterium RIFOXYC2_FULL_39_67]